MAPSNCASRRAIRAAFTLIELLVVVAIIALLVSILLPTLSSVKEQAKNMQCKANLHSIGTMMHVYINMNRDNFPLCARAEEPSRVNKNHNYPWYYAISHPNGSSGIGADYKCPPGPISVRNTLLKCPKAPPQFIKSGWPGGDMANPGFDFVDYGMAEGLSNNGADKYGCGYGTYGNWGIPDYSNPGICWRITDVQRPSGTGMIAEGSRNNVGPAGGEGAPLSLSCGRAGGNSRVISLWGLHRGKNGAFMDCNAVAMDGHVDTFLYSAPGGKNWNGFCLPNEPKNNDAVVAGAGPVGPFYFKLDKSK